MVRSRPEPEWDDEQRAWEYALAEVHADVCRGCGGQLSETTSEKMRDRYDVPPPHRCHRCTAIAMKSEDYKDSPHPTALLFNAVPKD